MRALRRPGATVVFDSRAEPPRASAGDAVVRPTLLGVTPVDAAIASGALPGPGVGQGVFGHEFVGVVESVEGAGAKHALAGQRVVASINVPCGACDLCRGGLSNHCRARTVLGVRGREGCFAERFAIPVSALALVPKSVSDEAALFAGALADALQAVTQLRVEGKPYITVLGESPLALLTTQAMARLNGSVRLVGRAEAPLSICERWGVKHRPLSDVGRRADQDVVVDCTGSQAGLDLALRMVRPRGKVLLKGRFGAGEWGAGAPVDLGAVVENEIEVIGSRSGVIGAGLAELATGRVMTEGLITRRARFDDALRALDAAGRGDELRVALEV